MKHLFVCMVIAATTALLLASATFAAPAQQREEKMHQMTMGNWDVWVISTAWRDQPAEVLLPKTQAHKDAIARAYPDGKMRNSLNVLLVRGPDFWVLVDTGLPASLADLKEGMTAAGATPEDITHVIITHAHGDHIGGLTADGKAVFPKARVILSDKEHDFWLTPSNEALAPPRAKTIFAQLPAALAPYAGRVDKTPPETEVLPGIRLMAAFGHTPGHVAVLVQPPSTQGLLFWGDLVHGMLVQTDWPDVSASYDVDPEISIAARKALLNRAVKEQWLVTGVHVPGVAPWLLP